MAEVSTGEEGICNVRDTAGWNWCFVGPCTETLPLVGCGDGGFDMMHECYEEAGIDCMHIFGVLRLDFQDEEISEQMTSRFVFVRASKMEGKRVTATKRGQLNVLAGAMEKTIKDLVGYVHLCIHVESSQDFDIEEILGKLRKLTPAHADVMRLETYENTLRKTRQLFAEKFNQKGRILRVQTKDRSRDRRKRTKSLSRIPMPDFSASTKAIPEGQLSDSDGVSDSKSVIDVDDFDDPNTDLEEQQNTKTTENPAGDIANRIKGVEDEVQRAASTDEETGDEADDGDAKDGDAKDGGAKDAAADGGDGAPQTLISNPPLFPPSTREPPPGQTAQALNGVGLAINGGANPGEENARGIPDDVPPGSTESEPQEHCLVTEPMERNVPETKGKEKRKLHVYQVGEPVWAWYTADKKWIDDGIVTEVTKEEIEIDGKTLPVNSIKVKYNRNKNWRWLNPEQQADFSRPSARPWPPQSFSGELYKEIMGSHHKWSRRFVNLTEGYVQWWYCQDDVNREGAREGSALLLDTTFRVEGTRFWIRTAKGRVHGFDTTQQEIKQQWVNGFKSHAKYVNKLQKHMLTQEEKVAKLRAKQKDEQAGL